MIAIDWSHTKDLTTFDGKKVRIESVTALLKRLHHNGGESTPPEKSRITLHPPLGTKAGGESPRLLKSTVTSHPPAVVLEAGCPMSLIYRLILAGATVALIDNKATENYRKEHGVEKTDENDARIIYELAKNGAKLTPITLDHKLLQMHDVYHQYCRYQKARVALQNMRKAHLRHYGSGAGESTLPIQSVLESHLVPDLLPYDTAIDTLRAREKSLLKRLETIAKGLPLFEAGGESNASVKSSNSLHSPAIKGLGQRLWLGIIVTANPSNFKCLSAYLRFCGLTSDVMATHKYNRHAKMLYHMLAEEVMKQRDPQFRPIYDKCKADIAEKHPDYTKGHCHNGALNRTATFLAKHIYKEKN